ncbi:MAG TPA: COX15/CtaA family protein [Gemmatimonadales bacterium]|nr:COX15/CtaA family protein [Gemmatimonadales bacterium]
MVTLRRMRITRTIAFVTAGGVYGLIVLGAVVRITGSGMGCGDDWPMCNGRLIPSLSDLPTLIEWTHRLVALIVSVMVASLAALTWLRRSEPGMAGPGGPLRPALLAVVLLVVQIMLGAITVWLELPPATVVLHLGTAMALLAVVLVSGLRAAARVSASPSPAQNAAAGRDAPWAVTAAVLGAITILLGGVTASVHAGPACQGFPLCSGQWWPAAPSGLPAIHWVHRLAAYGLFAYLLLILALPSRAALAFKRPIWLALALAVVQIAVAAAMVLLALPTGWRALHAAVGTLVWIALVWWLWTARQPHAASA